MARGLRHGSRACESYSQGRRRSAGGEDHVRSIFYPDNGTGEVNRARFARNCSSNPGWMFWSERRSSIPHSSRSGWLSNAITRWRARDGASSVWRGASTLASPGCSSSIQAGNRRTSQVRRVWTYEVLRDFRRFQPLRYRVCESGKSHWFVQGQVDLPPYRRRHLLALFGESVDGEVEPTVDSPALKGTCFDADGR